MRNTIILACVAGGFTVQAQRVLHFTVTSGFDHGTREVSYALFQSIGLDLGITVDDAPTAGAFNDAGTLALYDAIVFSNTSGNAILNDEQRANFEEWSMNGGHVMGIHAASDTYRHSTANGNNTGTWDFYAELIGASVQEDPNHVSGTPPYELMHIGTHPSISNLPDPWLKNEEYYYWEGGYFNPDNNVVLEVEETIGPNGSVPAHGPWGVVAVHRPVRACCEQLHGGCPVPPTHRGRAYLDALRYDGDQLHERCTTLYLGERWSVRHDLDIPAERVHPGHRPHRTSDARSIIQRASPDRRRSLARRHLLLHRRPAYATRSDRPLGIPCARLVPPKRDDHRH